MTLVLLAGGGTAGHVTPALATADALTARGLDVEFVGTPAGLESRMVPAAGWTLHPVPAAPFQRKMSLDALRVPFVVLGAARRAFALLRRRRAAGVCVFGGYVSGPLALAALLARVPLVIHEQNAAPGLANRIAARWARVVAVSVPGTADRFRGAARVEVTGNPVRRDLAGADLAGLRDEAVQAFSLDPARTTILAFGGSLGARRLNDALVESVPRWSEPQRLQILHVTGQRDHERVTAAWATALERSELRVSCQPFVDRMDLAYAAADVVVARAGASTIAELTVLGLPSLLVPYPHALADEQTANAAAVAAAGGAVSVPDGELDGARLVGELEGWIAEPERRAGAARAAASLGRRDAAERLADLVVATLPGGAA